MPEQHSFFRIVTVIFLFVVAAQVLAAYSTILARWRPLAAPDKHLACAGSSQPLPFPEHCLGLFLIDESVVTGHSGSVSSSN
jgi:hypothetical protein